MPSEFDRDRLRELLRKARPGDLGPRDDLLAYLFAHGEEILGALDSKALADSGVPKLWDCDTGAWYACE